MESKQKGILIVSLIALVLMAIGITYAYFTASIEGKETASTVVVTGGIMQIEYSENSNVILMENIYPRTDAWVTKTITITGTNTTDLQMKYDLGLNVINNTFSHYLSYDLTLLEGDNGTPIANVTNKAIVGTGYKRFGIGVFNNASSEVHKYELKIYLKDNNINQNEVQNGIFNAKVVIKESGITDPNEEIAMFLTGTEVNLKMKQLAGDDTTTNGVKTENTTITAIKRSSPLKEGLTDENIVSTDTSVYPIYIWYDNGTIYYYTEADKPYLNSDASSMFRQFLNLTDISGLSEMDASSANTLKTTFCKNYKLINIDALSNWDVSRVTDMSYLFFAANSLSSLAALSNWDTSSVTNMQNMFLDTISLTSLHGLENWDTSNVTNMTYLFQINPSSYVAGKRSSLRDISALSNWNVSNVTSMSDIFYNNTSIESLEALSNWDVSNVTNMENMFSGLTITNLHGLENWDVSNVKNMVAMFMIGADEYNAGLRSNLSDISALFAWDTSNVTNMVAMFQYATSLTNLHGLENWNTSKVTDMKNMFNLASSITDISALSNWDTSKVTSMNWMFNSNTSLKEADIGNWDLTKISSTTNANIFAECTGLERLKTPKVYPTKSGVKINLPVTLKDSLGTSYTSLGAGSPTSTWLTR